MSIVVNSIRYAFERRTVLSTASAKVENMVAKVLLHSSSGVLKDLPPNARLSFRTAKLLGMPECSNPLALHKGRPSMPFDRMVRGEEAV